MDGEGGFVAQKIGEVNFTIKGDPVTGAIPIGVIQMPYFQLVEGHWETRAWTVVLHCKSNFTIFFQLRNHLKTQIPNTKLQAS